MKQGYGKIFSDLKIKNNILIKKSKNDLGKKKIQNEINFYNFILKNNINFPIPKIYSYTENKIEMCYYKNYLTLLDYFEKINKNNKLIIEKVFYFVKILHSHSEIILDRNEFQKLIFKETIEKVKNRYLLINEDIKKYNYIKKVNNIEIYSFEYLINRLEERLKKEIEKLESKLHPIHGDIHLNNILINPDNINDIIFIDPKGIFGNKKTYGLKEYDYSKFYFGIEGYSKFDFSVIDNLNIENDNINIKMDKFHINKKNNLIEILIILIWLGNAHAFQNHKRIISYFYSLYLGKLFL